MNRRPIEESLRIGLQRSRAAPSEQSSVSAAQHIEEFLREFGNAFDEAFSQWRRAYVALGNYTSDETMDDMNDAHTRVVAVGRQGLDRAATDALLLTDPSVRTSVARRIGDIMESYCGEIAQRYYFLLSSMGVQAAEAFPPR